MLFRTFTPPWNLTRLNPKGIPADSPVPVQQADSQLDTNPLNLKAILSFEKQAISPGGKFSESTVQHNPGSLEQPHPPGNAYHAADSTVSVQ